MHVKREIRVLGIDDGFFNKFRDKEVLVIGVVMRGGLYLDAVLSTRVKVDGWDATEKIIEMVRRSRHREQIRVIMTDGISLGGFNMIDLNKIYSELGIPAIAVTRKYPNFDEILNALKHLNDWEKRWEIIKRLGEPKRVLIRDGYVYFQYAGLTEEEAREIIRKTSVNSRIPEPIRVAHLIAEGVTLGESKGKP